MPKHLYPILLLFSTLSPFSIAIQIGEADIEFRGYVIDDAPKWQWRIAIADQYWPSDINDAVRNSEGEYVFSFHDKGNFPFLEGYLKKVAQRGGTDLSPVITFGTQGQKFTVIGHGQPTDQHYRAAVTAVDAETGQPVGQLRFQVEQGLGVVTGVGESVTNRPQESKGRIVNTMLLAGSDGISAVDARQLSGRIARRLVELIRLNEGVIATGGTITYSQTQGVGRLLGEMTQTDLAASYASILSDFELVLSNGKKRVSHWRATISVSVTVP